MSETAPKSLTLFEAFKLKSSKQITAKIMEWKEKSVENVKSRSSSLSVYSRRESSTIDFGKYALPRLKNGVFEEADIEYKTGARYKGQVHGTKKAGKGTFTWPNGAKYEGEFVDDVRQGHGIQTFEDGTVYDGEFKDDMRHGDGMMTWPNRETYEGKFFKDRRHGFGNYMWPDRSYYKGMFYMDLKEGYGKFSFADGTKFQGLYKCDERHGPGVQTYKGGCEDVGLWQREKLVRLCTDLDNAFTIKNTEFASSADDNQPLYIYPEYFKNRTDVIEAILNPPEQFSYPPDVDIASKAAEEIFSEFLYRKSLAVDIRAFDEAFFDADVVNRVMSRAEKRTSSPVKSETINEEEGRDAENASPTVTVNDRVETPKKTESRQGSAVSTASTVPVDPSCCHEGLGVIDEETKVAVWNKTPSIVAMQKHVIRHQNSQKYVKFDLQKILEGDRYEFGYPGPLEEASIEFLKAASEGDLNKIADMLAEEKVHVDVADKSGHTALLGAAVNCEQDVINCLLDNGADVNKLSDEGVSALTAAHVFFYPSERFRYNIAEHQGAPPANMEREPGYDVNEAVKGLLGTKRPGVGAAKKQTEEEKIDERKINELRKEYEFMKDSKDGLDKLAVEDSKKEEEKHLGKLKFKRASHTDVDDALAIDHSKPPQTHSETRVKKPHPHSKSDEKVHKKDAEEFSSNVSIQDYPIDISNQLINKGIAALTHNEMVTEREKSDPSSPASLGAVRRMAITKKEERAMEATIRLLLQRGADPNASAVPMPPLFFAVKAADVEAVRLLLLKGASTEAKLPDHKKGLTALHIATALPGEEGVKMTELLLNALANPDVKAVEDDSFLNRNLEEEWGKDELSEGSDRAQQLSGGKTPLHVACARDDNYKNASAVVSKLLEHHADPNLLCNGQSALTLAISSGNDKAVEDLLLHGADPNLLLTHGVGTALCVASSTEFENRRSPADRFKLISKLVKSGADIMKPVLVGPKRQTGTAVDYAYYMFNQDKRIAHMPYHALSQAERETYNARKQLLAKMGDLLRNRAIERETERLQAGGRSETSSPHFMYMGHGQKLPSGLRKSTKCVGRASIDVDNLPCDGISIGDGVSEDGMKHKRSKSKQGRRAEGEPKPFRYCYECGRSLNVRLTPCSRCKQVYYCSKVCKVKAWNSRHKDECIRIGGLKGPSRPNTATKQTDGDKSQKFHPYSRPGMSIGFQNDPKRDLGNALGFKQGGNAAPGNNNMLFDPRLKNIDPRIARQIQGRFGSLQRSKQLEYLGSLNVKGFQGHAKGGSKAKKSQLMKDKDKQPPPPYIDAITGRIRTFDPVTGKMIWLDNYSLV